MGNTKIISRTPNELFKCASTVVLDTVDIDSESASEVLEFSGSNGCFYMNNCIVGDGIIFSADGGNILDLKTTSFNLKNKMMLEDVNNIVIDNVDININASCKYSLFPSEGICKINSSDIYLMDVTMNIHTIDSADVACEIDNSYAKNINIDYKLFYDSSICNDIVFGDDVVGNIWSFWYGDIALIHFSFLQSTVIAYDTDTTFWGNNSDGISSNNSVSVSSSTESVHISGALNGSSDHKDHMDKNQFSFSSNSTFFADVTQPRNQGHSGCSDGVFGLFAGGYFFGTGSDYLSSIERFKFSSTATSQSYGDLVQKTHSPCSFSDGVWGFWGGGSYGGYFTAIDRTTIASGANTINIGDLSLARRYSPSAGDRNTALIMGGRDGSSTIDLKSVEQYNMPNSSVTSSYNDLYRSHTIGGACSDGNNIVVAGNNGGGYGSRETEKTVLSIGSSFSFHGDILDQDCDSGTNLTSGN